MACGNIRNLYEVSQKELKDIAEGYGVIRAGATNDIKRRIGQYERDGYSGEVYFAKTTNMKYAENSLLHNYYFRHNVHQSSNVSDEPGYVYVIKGKRYKSTVPHGNIRELYEVSQKDLKYLADESGVIRAGATNDIDRRIAQYEREGYSGEVYFAETNNMRFAENNLLRNFDFRHNVQQSSNALEEPGYVYLIKGKKYN